ncbi:MAG: hypothetical protein KKF66_07760 [Actinobacteria bacterium]|nr:hypothetical protein [Actinomycetota bacterium]
MRKLYYVPTVHTEMDLGSLGTSIGSKGRAIAGEKRWKDHQQTVSRFWDLVADYFMGMDVEGLKVYQDGLMADGELGMNIVHKVATDGSKNYRLILELVDRGAKLMKTESEELLIKEYKRILELSKAKSLPRKSAALVKYRLGKKELTRKRDIFIAMTINGTLEEGEKGAIFIGAYHDIPSGLSADIEVVQLKNREKLLEYMKEVAIGRNEGRLRELALYAASPIPVA